MSNLLPSADAQECAPVADSPAVMEALPDRAVQLGALTVHRVLPVKGRRLIGPWCFFDRFGPLTFSGEKPMDVAPHPHIGLQTVTWLLSGEIVHNDSLGSECLVRPGQLSLMTAGRGIAHTEETPRVNSGILDGVQLWVALPDAHRSIDPFYQCTQRQPVTEVPGAVLTSVLGGYLGAESAGRQFSPGVGVDIDLQPGASVTLPLDPAFEYGILLTSGTARVFDTDVNPDTLYYLGSCRGELGISSATGARLLLIGGEPFGETILMWWNFVARTAGEITAARTAWEQNELFGPVPRYSGPRLASPEFLGRLISR